MKWMALLLVVANMAAFYLFRADQSLDLTVDLPRPVGAARLILIEELNFTERNGLRIEGQESRPSIQSAASADSFNLIRQPVVEESDVVVGAEAEAAADALVETLADASIEIEPAFDPALEGQCEILRAEDDELGGIIERLESVDMNPYLVEESVETPGPIMVYILPFSSFRQASLELNVLRRENIESFILPEGELQNGISVGVFSTGQNAQARADQMQALGYQTGEYQYTVEQAQYAVHLPLRESVTLAVNYWRELASDFPSMIRVQNSCF